MPKRVQGSNVCMCVCVCVYSMRVLTDDMLKTDTTHTLPVTAGFITLAWTFVNLDGRQKIGNKTICHGHLFTHTAALYCICDGKLFLSMSYIIYQLKRCEPRGYNVDLPVNQQLCPLCIPWKMVKAPKCFHPFARSLHKANKCHVGFFDKCKLKNCRAILSNSEK